MITAPAVTVTDELIVEIERMCSENKENDGSDSDWLSGFSVGDFKALLAERAELKRDAEEYRKLRDGSCWPAVFASSVAAEPLRGYDLDAAMHAAS
jgi:hypothetical protein